MRCRTSDGCSRNEPRVMSHLTRDELLRFAEDGLEPRTLEHLEVCAACRDEAEGLSAVIADVRGVAVPEPAPAFWDHLSSRVRHAIATEPVPRPARWWDASFGQRAAWLSASAALAVATIAYVAWPVTRPAPASPPHAAAETLAPAVQEGTFDDEWAMLDRSGRPHRVGSGAGRRPGGQTGARGARGVRAVGGGRAGTRPAAARRHLRGARAAPFRT